MSGTLWGRYLPLFFFDTQKQLWLGSWGLGLKKFDRNTKTFEEYRWTPVTTGTKNICYSIGQYGSNQIWINTEAGAVLFNTETHRFRAVCRNGVDGGRLTPLTMMQNSNGVLWLADATNLVRINPADNHFNFVPLDRLFDKKPAAVAVHSFIRRGPLLYTGVLHEGFLVEYNLASRQFNVYNPFPGLGSGINHLSKDSRGNIWIAGLKGVTVFGAATKKFSGPSPPKTFPHLFRLQTYFILHDDGTTWLATEQGLVHYNAGQKTARLFVYDTTGITRPMDNKLYAHTYTIYKDSKGNIWFGNSIVGLSCYHRATGTVIHFNKRRNKTYPEGSCKSITEAKDGSILFTLEEAGLGVLKKPFTKNENITVLTSSDGLPSDGVFRVFKDKRDHIWLFTTNGLGWLDVATGQSRRFGKEDGLAETVINSKPYQDEEENMYLGFTKSFQVFNPQKLLASGKDTGFIHLASLQVNGNAWPLNPNDLSSLQLVHTQNNIAFDFAFLSPDHTPGFQYTYKLDGLDKQWNRISAKTFGQYNNLSPGNYTLRIKAQNPNGVWSKSEYALPIIIQPP